MPGSEPMMSTDQGELLRVHGLTAGYAGSSVLFGVDLVVPERGIVALLGRNGAGKTTLVRTLMGYLPSYSGSVVFAGKDVTHTKPTRLVREGFGYVPQEHVVFPTLTVHENLLLGRTAAPRSSTVEVAQVLELFPSWVTA
ncbi:MAG TPA: ATP-binding cassette domain-containing protein [Dermatophilaceae bacterium]